MPPSATSSNGSLILEEPLIRTPYELLRRSHRSAQRQVEKDFIVVQSALSSIIKNLGPPSEDQTTSILTKLDNASDRIRGLKRKLDDLQPDNINPTSLRHRLTYLEQLNKISKPITGVVTTKTVKQPLATSAEDVNMEDPNVANPVPPTDAQVHVGEGVQIGGDVVMGESGIEVAQQMQKSESQREAASASARTDGEGQTEEEPQTEPATPPNEDDDKTLDRYIVDYLLRTGRMQAAKALSDAQGIDQLVDIKLFAELIKIERALLDKHSVTEALAWCGENRGTLKKTKNNLEFTLRLQEFVELCRKRDTIGAITYSRKNLAPWAPTHMSEIQQGMALLAFGERTGVGAYSRLYDSSRWQAVRNQFRDTFLTLYALPSQPLLSLALSAGLSSLRLPSCAPYENLATPKSPVIPLLPAAPPLHNLDASLSDATTWSTHIHEHPTSITLPPKPAVTSPEAVTGSVDCPTCGSDMKVLAKEVPMSHHVNSTIVCRISGQVMDSDNEPLAFPNGYVYSTKALAEMAKNNFDVVTCPRTLESCAFSRLRKVYIS